MNVPGDASPTLFAALQSGQFSRIQALAYEQFGLNITDQKLTMVNNRLVNLMRQQGLNSLEDLIQRYEQARTPAARLPLFDCLSTNLTMFYREADHYQVLVQHLIEPMAKQPGRSGRRLRLWSAGCSKGCEPYTMSMVLRDAVSDLTSWDARILGTDLAVSELQFAKKAIYPTSFVDDLDPGQVRRHFERGRKDGASSVRVRPDVTERVTFALLNLVDPWTLRGPFDAIFCRNVMIYFDEPTRERLVDRFKDLLRPGGFLFLGSSEGLPGNHDDLLRIAPSAFRKQ